MVRILTTLRRERELRERTDSLARRSLERAHSVMERARDRLRDDIINEFVREAPDQQVSQPIRNKNGI